MLVRCWLLCLRALIRNGMGESLSFLEFLYVSFLLKNMLLKIYLLNNFYYDEAFVPRI